MKCLGDYGEASVIDDKVVYCYHNLMQILEKEVAKMKISTTYMENYPSQNYKTRQFTRTIEEILSDDVASDKTKVIEVAHRQQKMCEYFVREDIKRHEEELKALSQRSV